MAGEQLGTQLLYALFRRLDRRYIEDLRRQYDFRALSAKYERSVGRRFIETLCGLVAGVGAFAALSYGSYLLFHAYATRDPDIQHIWTSPSLITGPLSFSIAATFTLGVLVALLREKLKYGENWHEYRAFECLKMGFDTYRRTRQVVTFLVVPFFILAIFSADDYHFVTSRQVVLNPFGGFGEKRYPISEVVALRQRSTMGVGEKKNRLLKYYAVEFMNGFDWRIQSGAHDVSPRDRKEGAQIVEYLSAQTGIPITVMPVDP
jgi:hypothetical protein